ncbi:response regulator, partial [bacterium]|nr:response regulator [bacterium]
ELVNSIQEGLGLVDANEVIQYCNPALARVFEVPVYELVGRSLRDFVDDTSWQKIRKETELRKIGKDSVYEATIRTGQGNLRHIMINASPRLDADGKFLGTFGLIQDITEQKKAERERERLLQQLGQRVDELSSIYSISRVIEANDSLSELMQEIADRIVPGTVIPNETYAAVVLDDDMWESHPEKRQSDNMLEVPITIEGMARGKIVVSRQSAYPFSDGEEQLLRRIAESVQRAVLRKELQEQLFFAQKMESIRTLAGGIAHDFNNLMMGVLGSVELLGGQLDAEHPATSLLKTIEESAKRAGLLARQLLTYARGGEHEPKRMNLNEAIENLLNLQDKVLADGVHMEGHLASDVPEIDADPAQIQQVLLNLCANAAEAMPNGGQIQITTQHFHVDKAFARSHTGLNPGTHVCLTLKDNGCGMNAKALSRLFEPFYTTKSEGRGLGLAVVYGIVKNHNGYIEAESIMGKGTTFRIYFPAAKSPVPAAPKLSVHPPRIKTVTILLIDDDIMVLQIIQQLLERLDYRVLTASNGREALSVVDTYRGEIDVALLDLGMPVMNGHEAFPLLKERRPEMKILICSGYAANGPAKELVDQGAAGFVPKPFDLDTLSNALEDALNGRASC